MLTGIIRLANDKKFDHDICELFVKNIRFCLVTELRAFVTELRALDLV